MKKPKVCDACHEGHHDDCSTHALDFKPCGCDCNVEGSDLRLMLEERESERDAEAHEVSGTQQMNRDARREARIMDRMRRGVKPLNQAHRHEADI